MWENDYFDRQLMKGEKIIWQGTPQKRAFVLQRCLTLLPIAVVWLCFDIPLISSILRDGEADPIGFFLVPFFLLHLMPVWIWLALTLTAVPVWKKTAFAVTDRRILLRGGFFGTNYTTLNFTEIADCNLRIGFFDKLFHTSSVSFNCPDAGNSGKGFVFSHLEDGDEAYARIQETIYNGRRDDFFPNDQRNPDSPAQ